MMNSNSKSSLQDWANRPDSAVSQKNGGVGGGVFSPPPQHAQPQAGKLLNRGNTEGELSAGGVSNSSTLIVAPSPELTGFALAMQRENSAATGANSINSRNNSKEREEIARLQLGERGGADESLVQMLQRTGSSGGASNGGGR